MKFMKTQYNLFLVLILVAFGSCKNLTELNVNPNVIELTTVDPNFLIPTVITSTALPYSDMNFEGDMAGVMSYIQKSGWGSGVNNFYWKDGRDWSGHYGTLRNILHLYNRSKAEGMEFHEGVALVLKSFQFACITDGWGDAPYTDAVKAAAGGQADLFPVFDSQETIYKGIIADLKSANTLLSKPMSDYSKINNSADVLFNGDPAKWRKMANSLLLRYYMRISSKLPDISKAGIEEIIANPTQFPLFSSNDDDAALGYLGNSPADSWPLNTVQDPSSSGGFPRTMLCAGFRDILLDLNDPRIAVWFSKVKMPIVVSRKYESVADTIVNVIDPANGSILSSTRYLQPDSMAEKNYVIYNEATWSADNDAGKVLIDTLEYVGIPLAYLGAEPMSYNLNPHPKQGGANASVSALADIYKDPSGDLLKARLISYSEVCFILAEAAKKGYSVGTQRSWYEKGIQASLDLWGVGDSYSDYVTNEGVAYDGSLKQIMVQKYIANWTVAKESWCDWRRTGLPAFTFGSNGARMQLPIRFKYDTNEININGVNAQAAIAKLVETPFTQNDGKDSSWSKIWLLQGSNLPY